MFVFGSVSRNSIFVEFPEKGGQIDRKKENEFSGGFKSSDGRREKEEKFELNLFLSQID